MTAKTKQGINIIVIYIAVWIAVMILYGILALPYMNSEGLIVISEAQEFRLISITNLALGGISSVAFIVFLRHYLKEQLTYTKNNYHQFIRVTLLGIAGLFLAVFITTIIMRIIGVTENSNNQEVLDSLVNAATFDRIALVIYTVLFAPFVEEIVFRRAVFGFFEKFNIPLAIIVSGLSFGFIHVLSGDYIQLIIYGALGITLAYAYYRSNKNIMTVIAIHMVYNLITTIVMFAY